MTTDREARHRKVRDVLLKAAEAAAPERARVIDDACGEDAALRAEVLALLDDASGPPTDAFRVDAAATTTLPPGATLGAYRIERRLGAGAMGTVYLARAPATGAKVALKVVHAHLVENKESRRRFLREAEVGRRIRHENVVRTLDAGSVTVDGSRVDYLVLEHVSGQTLRALRESWDRVPEALLREIARQAAAGLAAVHAAGIVHRDVKPDNLMLTDDDRLCVMDLGIAKGEVDASLTRTGQFVGSLLYAAPEQIESDAPGPPADLYALGVVLYEMATGTNPFEHEAAGAVLHAHLRKVPPPATSVTSDVSPFLSAVIQTLLEKDPAERFSSAAVLCDTLDAGEQGSWWRAWEQAGGARRTPLPARRDTPLLGRDPELRRIEDAWARAVQGDGPVRLVTGEDGLGKTRLLSEFVARRGAEPIEVLWTPDRPGDVVAPVAARLAAPGGDAVLARALEGLETWAPSVRAWLRRGAPPAEARRIDVDTRAAVVARVLRALADERPVAWIVDDLDDAEPEDVELLAKVLRNTGDIRVLTLLAGNPSLDGDVHRHNVPRVETVPLDRLSDEDTAQLATEVTGAGARAAVMATQVAELAEGVPLFALALAREIASHDELAVPETLRDQILRRTTRLDAEESEMLELAAVAGRHFDADPIAKVRGGSRLRVLQVLGRLERRHRLVRSQGDRFRFDHQLVHEVVYQSIPDALRAEIHRLLGEALTPGDAGDGPLPPELAAQIVDHHLAGTTPEAALPWIDPVLAWLSAGGRAARYIETAGRALDRLELTAGQRVHIRPALGRALSVAGRAQESRRVLEAALAEADAEGDARSQGIVRLALGTGALATGQVDEALEWYEAAIDRLGPDGSPRRVGDALGGIGQVHWHQGRLDLAEAAQRQVIELGRTTGTPRVEARGLADLSVLLHETGRLEEAERLARRAIAIQQRLGDHRNAATTLSNLGNVLFSLGRRLEAIDCYEQSIESNRHLMSRAGEAVALLNLGEVCAGIGEIARGETALRAALSISRYAEIPRIEGYVRDSLGVLELARGDPDAARRHFETSLEIREALGDARAAAHSKQALAAAADAAGDTETALRLVDDAEAASLEAAELDPEILARARRAALTGTDAEPVIARYREVEPRLRHMTRVEACHLLWRATGDRAWADAARRRLEADCEAMPPERRPAFRDGVALHRAVFGA